jgi:hypothetical protein
MMKHSMPVNTSAVLPIGASSKSERMAKADMSKRQGQLHIVGLIPQVGGPVQVDDGAGQEFRSLRGQEHHRTRDLHWVGGAPEGALGPNAI